MSGNIYYVTIQAVTTNTVRVEANSKDEAVVIAYDRLTTQVESLENDVVTQIIEEVVR